MFTLLDELWTMFRRQIMIILIVFIGLWILMPPVFDALIQYIFVDSFNMPWVVDLLDKIEQLFEGVI